MYLSTPNSTSATENGLSLVTNPKPSPTNKEALKRQIPEWTSAQPGDGAPPSPALTYSEEHHHAEHRQQGGDHHAEEDGEFLRLRLRGGPLPLRAARLTRRGLAGLG